MNSLDDNFDKFMELFSNTDDFMRGFKDAKKFRLLQMNDALWWELRITDILLRVAYNL